MIPSTVKVPFVRKPKYSIGESACRNLLAVYLSNDTTWWDALDARTKHLISLAVRLGDCSSYEAAAQIVSGELGAKTLEEYPFHLRADRILEALNDDAEWDR
jgi:hypothetical protein